MGDTFVDIHQVPPLIQARTVAIAGSMRQHRPSLLWGLHYKAAVGSLPFPGGTPAIGSADPQADTLAISLDYWLSLCFDSEPRNQISQVRF